MTERNGIDNRGRATDVACSPLLYSGETPCRDRAVLYHTSRVSLLGQLSASIVHQLSQPLTSILSNAEAAKALLDREKPDLAELRQICADIAAEDRRAAEIIRRLGALFRRSECQYEPIELNELVRDTLLVIRSELAHRHVAVCTELATSLPLITGDYVQLQQLLLNLIVNAADAMSELAEGCREVTISTAAQPDFVQICVSDRGRGVPVEARDNVFEPFWSTRPGGMGMGLAIGRSIALAHRGSLTVTNAPTGGALFCASLPAPHRGR